MWHIPPSSWNGLGLRMVKSSFARAALTLSLFLAVLPARAEDFPESAASQEPGCSPSDCVEVARLGYPDIAVPAHNAFTLPLRIRLNLDVRGVSRAVLPLHWAAIQNQVRSATVLLDHGYEVDAVDGEGRTPLMIAAAFGSPEVAEVLLDRGADPEARDADGDGPIHFAAMAGRAEIVELLLQRGVSTNVRSRWNGETALHLAALYGQPKVIRLLVENGADPDVSDDSGIRPLQYASRRLQGLAVRELLGLGARPDTLHDAVNAGDVARVHTLLAGGTDANLPDLFGTPLHLAASIGRTTIATMLIEKGADLEAESIPEHSRPLHAAALSNQAAIAQLLLDRGAQLEARDSQDRTPLMVAAAYGNVAIAKVLLTYGSNVLAQEAIYGTTPIHHATMSGNVEMVRLLLAHGVDVDIKSGREGRAPLTYAARHNDLPMIRFLVEHGADLRSRDSLGLTAIEAARKSGKGSFEAVSLLSRLEGSE